MNDLIAELIQSSKGYFYATAGVIIGFFNHPEQARRCANAITVTYGKTAEVCGNQISIAL